MQTKKFTAHKILTPFMVLSLTLAVFMLPAVAHAVNAGETAADLANLANSTTSEWSGIGLLKKLFGPMVSNPLSPAGGDTVLSQMFGVLNLAILAIGSLFMIYTTTAGIAQTAHEGELMGKRFSTLWTPVRMVTGTVSVVPVFHGWSLSQLIMLWFAMIGVGIGNQGWQVGAGYLANGGEIVVQALPSAESVKVARATFDSELCISARQAQATQDNESPMPNLGGKDLNGQGYQWGNLDNNGGQGDASCGAVTYPVAASAASGAGAAMTSFATGGAGADVVTASQTAAITAFQAMDTSAKALAKNLVDSIVQKRTDAASQVHPPADPINYSAGEIDDLAYQYQQNLASAKIQAAQSANSGAYSTGTMLANVLQTSQTMGFTSAGAWYSTIAGVSSTMENALSSEVKVVAMDDPNTVVAGSIRAEADSDIVLINDANNGTKSALGSPSSSSPNAEDKLIDSLISKWCPSSALANANANKTSAGQCIVEGIVGGAASSNSSVLVRMKTGGDYIVDMGVVGITVAGGAAGVVNGLGDGFSFDALAVKAAGILPGGKTTVDATKGVLSIWAGILKSLMEGLMGFGVMMSVWLPMLPFVTWVGAVATWLAVVVEAIVAAPLWAFAHMDAEGEGMGQRTSHGYLFILNLLFRPFLMVMGFLMMAIIIQVIGGLWLYLFPMAVASAQVDSWTGFVSIIGFIVVYCMGSISIVNIASNMIYMIPNNVLSWVGGTMINNFGEQMSNNTRPGGTVAGFANTAGSGATDKLGKAMGDALGRGAAKKAAEGGDLGDNG